MPERIDFDLTAPEGAVSMTDVPVVSLEARYLYGAPGAGLAIEGEARISAASGLQDFPGFHFGLHDERVDPRLESLPALGHWLEVVSIGYLSVDGLLSILLGIQFGRCQIAVSQNDTSHFDAVQLADFRGRRMAQLVRRPV